MNSTTKEIKKLLFDLDFEIKALAAEFGCEREELSMCINLHREYPALRKKLAKKLGRTVEQLFGAPDAAEKAA